MFLSRRIATMEVEFVSIERVMEYTRLPHEEGSNSNLGTTAELLTEHDGDIPAVLAENLYLRYEASWLWDSCPKCLTGEIWQKLRQTSRPYWILMKEAMLRRDIPKATIRSSSNLSTFSLKCHP